MSTFKVFLAEGVMLIEGSFKFKDLQKRKKPLSAEEREECLKKKAVWNNHPDPKKNPIPAVWKSSDSKGNPVYVTNTHRAFNTAPTLKGAINRYHSFIKSTA